jgi:hypothetical protein
VGPHVLPKHKMIVKFWWHVFTTRSAPHKFPKKMLGRGEYIFIFDSSWGNFKGEDYMMNYIDT